VAAAATKQICGDKITTHAAKFLLKPKVSFKEKERDGPFERKRSKYQLQEKTNRNHAPVKNPRKQNWSREITQTYGNQDNQRGRVEGCGLTN